MKFLPIVGRELRVAARRRGTYWLRSFVAAGVLLVSGWIFLFSFRESPRELGHSLFYTLTGGALLFCLFAGLRSTADCLSEEKREGTLGLLFLTDLKGYDVVLGKLAANSLSGFYGLLAILPVMAIPLLLGGLAAAEFARVAAVLVNTMFFSMCVGMFASASCRSARASAALTLLLVLLFTAAFPAWGTWLAWKAQTRNFESLWFLPSAGYTYALALETPFRRAGGAAFYGSLGVIHALGWIFLGLACVITPRSWQDRPLSERGERWRAWWQMSSFGSAAQRVAWRTRLLNVNPFFWLAARARLKPAWVWGFLGCMACGWTWGAFKYGRDWFNEGIYITTAFTLNSVLKLWFVSEAMRQLAEDRRMGTLELLLSTPLTVRDILRGQALALRRQFLGPVIFTLVAEVILFTCAPTDAVSHHDRVAWAAVWMAGMVMLVADLAALYWMGMWMGLAARNPKWAFSDAVARVLVLPWVGFAMFLTLVAVFSIRGNEGPEWPTVLGVWVALGLAADLGFGAWARHQLLTGFREAAARRYERRASVWSRLLGRAEAPGKR
jgi:ABC-type transport system involved in cytochrome c biogenesis permease component